MEFNYFMFDKPSVPSVRGFRVIGDLKVIKSRYPNIWQPLIKALPEKSYNAIQELIPRKGMKVEEYLKTIDDALRMFTLVAWYPFELELGLLIALKNVIGADTNLIAKNYKNDANNIIKEIAGDAAKLDLSGGLGYITSWGSTEFIMSMAARVWDKLLSHGSVEVVFKQKNYVKVKITAEYYKDFYPLEGQYAIQGWIEGAMETREKNSQVSCMYVDNKYFDLDIRWW